MYDEVRYTFVCTGDIHLSILKDIPKDWQISRYRQLFSLIIAECLEYNARLILTGDLFNRCNPTLEELKLMLEFFYMLEDNKIHTILVAGNHCGIAKGDNTFDYLHLDRFGPKKGFSYINYNTTPTITDDHIFIQPLDHDKLYSFTNLDKPSGKFNILVSHFRCTLNEYIKEEVNVEKLCQPYDLVIAGDIHEFHQIDNLWYTGQPINSLFEREPSCGFLRVTVEGNSGCNVERVRTYLPNLIQQDCLATEFENLKLDPQHFYRINVTGTSSELKAIPNVGTNFKVVKELQEEHTFNFQDTTEVTTDEPRKSRNMEEQFIDFMETSGYKEVEIKDMLEVYREV